MYFLKPPSRRRAVTALRPAPLVDAAFAETNPVPAKGVMEQLGLLRSGMARPPLAPLSDAAQARVRALLAPSAHENLSEAVHA